VFYLGFMRANRYSDNFHDSFVEESALREEVLAQIDQVRVFSFHVYFYYCSLISQVHRSLRPCPCTVL
jgi:hypothetical protein